ncbi:immunoglobulin-like domain-containing protein [Neobacillus sp. SCS-31]|uniref:immunoglobulin-like domain-containing protein n=1 Tax=Neobacillus oceani TaxID=3115292 RepID=UPI0039062466
MRENKHFFRLLFFISIFFSFSSSSYAAGAGSQDKEKPVLAGITHEIIFIGQAFTPLEGVSAKDNVDGNLTRKIVVSGKVNTKKAGQYVLTYTVYDKAKNKAMAVRTITVIKDTVEPELSGIANKSIYISKAFDPLFGVTAMDNADGDVTSSIEVSGRVNEKKAGKYKLIYSVRDKAGNIASRERIVTVIDNIKPVFSGVGNIELVIGESFHPLKGVTAFDNNDGDLTGMIKVSGYINTRELGINTIIYSVKDKAGNKAKYKRTITVKEGPDGYLEFLTDYVSPDNGMTVTMKQMSKTNLGECYEYSVA